MEVTLNLEMITAKQKFSYENPTKRLRSSIATFFFVIQKLSQINSKNNFFCKDYAVYMFCTAEILQKFLHYFLEDFHWKTFAMKKYSV